ncbi:hypothetical protein WA158_005479 [Blastocystis sp. Blastoise]
MLSRIRGSLRNRNYSKSNNDYDNNNNNNHNYKKNYKSRADVSDWRQDAQDYQTNTYLNRNKNHYEKNKSFNSRTDSASISEDIDEDTIPTRTAKENIQYYRERYLQEAKGIPLEADTSTGVKRYISFLFYLLSLIYDSVPVLVALNTCPKDNAQTYTIIPIPKEEESEKEEDISDSNFISRNSYKQKNYHDYSSSYTDYNTNSHDYPDNIAFDEDLWDMSDNDTDLNIYASSKQLEEEHQSFLSQLQKARDGQHLPSDNTEVSKAIEDILQMENRGNMPQSDDDIEFDSHSNNEDFGEHVTVPHGIQLEELENELQQQDPLSIDDSIVMSSVGSSNNINKQSSSSNNINKQSSSSNNTNKQSSSSSSNNSFNILKLFKDNASSAVPTENVESPLVSESSPVNTPHGSSVDDSTVIPTVTITAPSTTTTTTTTNNNNNNNTLSQTIPLTFNASINQNIDAILSSPSIDCTTNNNLYSSIANITKDSLSNPITLNSNNNGNNNNDNNNMNTIDNTNNNNTNNNNNMNIIDNTNNNNNNMNTIDNTNSNKTNNTFPSAIPPPQSSIPLQDLSTQNPSLYSMNAMSLSPSTPTSPSYSSFPLPLSETHRANSISSPLNLSYSPSHPLATSTLPPLFSTRSTPSPSPSSSPSSSTPLPISQDLLLDSTYLPKPAYMERYLPNVNPNQKTMLSQVRRPAYPPLQRDIYRRQESQDMFYREPLRDPLREPLNERELRERELRERELRERDLRERELRRDPRDMLPDPRDPVREIYNSAIREDRLRDEREQYLYERQQKDNYYRSIQINNEYRDSDNPYIRPSIYSSAPTRQPLPGRPMPRPLPERDLSSPYNTRYHYPEPYPQGTLAPRPRYPEETRHNFPPSQPANIYNRNRDLPPPQQRFVPPPVQRPLPKDNKQYYTTVPPRDYYPNTPSYPRIPAGYRNPMPSNRYEQDTYRDMEDPYTPSPLPTSYPAAPLPAQSIRGSQVGPLPAGSYPSFPTAEGSRLYGNPLSRRNL